MQGGNQLLCHKTIRIRVRTTVAQFLIACASRVTG